MGKSIRLFHAVILDCFMLTILGLGFLLGLQHAMEADHLAAVAAIAAGHSRRSRILHHELFWGLGHALALTALATLVVLSRGGIPPGLAFALELVVAFMLIGLGVMVVWRVVRERLHFHLHRHNDGKVHFHAHGHAGERQAHGENSHDHGHVDHGVRRSLLVGIMHGLAGSAALIALAAPSQRLEGAGFILLFGLGSIGGMVLLSSIIALPLVLTGRLMAGLNRGLQLGIGMVSIAIGGFHAMAQAPQIITLF